MAPALTATRRENYRREQDFRRTVTLRTHAIRRWEKLLARLAERE